MKPTIYLPSRLARLLIPLHPEALLLQGLQPPSCRSRSANSRCRAAQLRGGSSRLVATAACVPSNVLTGSSSRSMSRSA
jgi:hypothetical protein